MYFMIGVWGGEQRQYAAIKFFLYTLFGSALMLVGFLALFFQTGAESFSMAYLAEHSSTIAHSTQLWIFGGMFIGFAVKVPMFPFHTWLPDAHTQAPTVGLGHPGRHPAEARHVRLHPHRHPHPPRRRPDLGAVDRRPRRHRHHLRRALLPGPDRHEAAHRLLVGGAHGLRDAGIATLTSFGLNAAVFGMVAHGLITGMLFFLAGSVKERYHTLEISQLGGLLKVMPRLGWVMGFCAMASLGLPGLAGFWGEFPAILSAYNPAAGLKVETFRIFMVVAAVGTVLAAGYLLWLYQRAFFGDETPFVLEAEHHGHVADILPVEYIAWTPLLIGILVLGIYPNLLFKVLDPAVGVALRAVG